MSDYELGQHSAQIGGLSDRLGRLEQSVGSMDKKLDTIIVSLAETAAEKRVERKVIAAVATAAGGFGSLLITVLLKLVGGV